MFLSCFAKITYTLSKFEISFVYLSSCKQKPVRGPAGTTGMRRTRRELSRETWCWPTTSEPTSCRPSMMRSRDARGERRPPTSPIAGPSTSSPTKSHPHLVSIIKKKKKKKKKITPLVLKEYNYCNTSPVVDPGFSFREGGGGGPGAKGYVPARTLRARNRTRFRQGSRVILMVSRAIWALFLKHSENLIIFFYSWSNLESTSTFPV